MIHVDAHTDLYGPFMGSRIHHGNPFLNAVEEELIDCNRTIQIGLRGTGYGDDYEVGKKFVSLLRFVASSALVEIWQMTFPDLRCSSGMS